MFSKDNHLLLPAIVIFGLFLALFSSAIVFLRFVHPAQTTKLLELRTLVFFFLFYFIVVYIWGYKKVKKNDVRLEQIVVPSVVFAVLAFLFLPLASGDLYTHFYRARTIVNYSANPYFDTYSNYSYDEYYSVLSNDYSAKTALYGPFFSTITAAISFFTGSKLFITIYAIKFLFLLCFFATAVLLYKITRSKMSLYLLGWNPIVIFFGLLDGHVDIFILFLIIISLYFATKKCKQRLYCNFMSWLMFLLSVLIKIYYLPLGLIVYYLILKDTKQLNEKIMISMIILLQSVVVILLSYLPFWRGPETLNRLFQVYSLYGKGNYSFGAIPFVQEPVFATALRYFLGVALFSFTGFILFKVSRAILYNEVVNYIYLYSAILYILFLLNLSRIWNSWYWLFPIGILSLASNYDEGKYSYKLIVFLCFFSSFYVFF